jgi:hypothetical protein
VKRARIYLDTSVIGGCFDPEFAGPSGALMRDFEAGLRVPVVSTLVADEVGTAPPQVRAQLASLLEREAVLIEEDLETAALADAYRARNIVSAKYANDGLHVALATLADVDVLASWNFKHIVHLDKIRLFNAVNLERGYRPVDIRSPPELIRYGTDR